MRKVLLSAPMSSVHERFNIANLEALKSLDCEIHLTANFSIDTHAIEYKNKCEKEGYIIHDIPFVRHSFKDNLSCVPQFKKLLKEEKFDLVHCHTETGGLLVYLSEKADKKTKYMYTPHGMSFYKGSSLKSQLTYRPIEKLICSKMDVNIAINDEEYEVLSSWKKESAKFVHGAGFDFDTINNVVVDIDRKKEELGIPLDKELILSVGELDDNKNHKVILEAISRISKDKRPYLLICGEGENRNQLISLAKKYDYEDCLFLPGYRYDMSEIFRIADLFVFPSYHEGLSFALMQAMASKLPVLCSRIRGNVDLIDEDKGGCFFEPDDSSLLYELINNMLNDETKRKEFGLYNFEKSKLYSLHNVKNELEIIYKELLEVTV